MAELIRQFSSLTEANDGTQYVARVYGEQRRDRVWIGWIEFSPLNEERPVRTAAQTERINRNALASWAAGLEGQYLQSVLRHSTGARRTL